MSSELPGWVQEYVALGGASLLTGLLTWWTGHRTATAQARKLEAEAEQDELCRSAEFEKALNERAARLIDSLEKQVSHLSSLVEAQTKQLAAQTRQLAAQSGQIALMEIEIRDLRKALDSTTSELHSARARADECEDCPKLLSTA